MTLPLLGITPELLERLADGKTHIVQSEEPDKQFALQLDGIRQIKILWIWKIWVRK